MRQIDFPTRETNSSHASSSLGPAHRQTTSFKVSDEYRVLRLLSIILCFVEIAGLAGAGAMAPAGGITAV